MDPNVCAPTILDLFNILAWFTLSYVTISILSYRQIKKLGILPGHARTFVRHVAMMFVIGFLSGRLTMMVHLIG